MTAINGKCSARRPLKGRLECGGGLHPRDPRHGGDKDYRPFRGAMSRDRRREIISAYFKTLDRMKTSIGVESDLPFPKEIIRVAILRELAENSGSDSKGLEIGYVQLEAFISLAEYRVLEDFMSASRLAQDLVETADPTTIMISAGIMRNAEGDRAVRIQEKISERMHERLVQIQEITGE
ncbi:MAG: hypothetical protein ABFD97_15930 [Syntrophobacter sp.]